MNLQEFSVVFKQQKQNKNDQEIIVSHPKGKQLQEFVSDRVVERVYHVMSQETQFPPLPQATPGGTDCVIPLHVFYPCCFHGFLHCGGPPAPSTVPRLWPWKKTVSSPILLPFLLSASNLRALWLLKSKDSVERPGCSEYWLDVAELGDSVSPLQPHPIRKMWREHRPRSNQSLEWGPDYLPEETVIYG